MSDVFVSYKAEDRKRVRPLVDALEAEGLTVWWDAQIGGGDEWRRSIERELDAAKAVLVVWSKRSTGPEGRFVRDEASRAMERGVYLPVRIDNVRLPLGFGETQALNLTSWKGGRDDGRYQAVLAAIRAIAGGRPHEGHRPRYVDEGVSRRGVIAGGVVAAVAVAGVGGWSLFKPSAAGASTSIAVLPFANLSGDAAQAYFSDGIAEELRGALARIGMQVVGRTSSDEVKDEDTKAAAAKLGVSNILTGSVRRSPSLIRISAQLVDGKNGLERWSQSYDRQPGDALKIQTDIAENVAQALSVALAPSEQRALKGSGTGSAKAHDLFLQADTLAKGGAGEEVSRKRLQLFDAAIAADPNYVAALAGRAQLRANFANLYESGARLRFGMADAVATARRAVALDPQSPIAQAALGKVLMLNLQQRAGIEHLERAYRLAPGDPKIIAAYAQSLRYVNRNREAVPLAERAVALDPLNPGAIVRQAEVLLYARRYGEAIAALRHARLLEPGDKESLSTLGDSFLLAGRPREAIAAFAGVPSDWDRLRGEAIAADRMGDRTLAERKLTELKAIDDGSLNFQFAEIYAQWGQPEKALESLAAADRADDPGLALLAADPLMDPLRSDPRFQALVKKRSV
jgi:TolB-like protein/Flp pilus assembly protein TadD